MLPRPAPLGGCSPGQRARGQSRGPQTHRASAGLSGSGCRPRIESGVVRPPPGLLDGESFPFGEAGAAALFCAVSRPRWQRPLGARALGAGSVPIPLTPLREPTDVTCLPRPPLMGNMSHVAKCTPSPCWVRNPAPVADFPVVICSAHMVLLGLRCAGGAAAARALRGDGREQQPHREHSREAHRPPSSASSEPGPGGTLRVLSLRQTRPSIPPAVPPSLPAPGAAPRATQAPSQPLSPRGSSGRLSESGPHPGAPSAFPGMPPSACSAPLLQLLPFLCLSLLVRVSMVRGQKSAASSVLVTTPGAQEGLGDPPL